MLFTTKMGKEKKGFLRRGIITAPYSYPSIEGTRISMSWKLVIGRLRRLSKRLQPVTADRRVYSLLLI
jgi:hypothetical protein